jgi:hypothetical protein
MIDVVAKVNPLTNSERLYEKDFDQGRTVVRVVPKNAELRKYLKHGVTKVGFLAEGSAEWPNDSFTRKRIKDGDVTVEEAAAPEGGQQQLLQGGQRRESGAKAAPEQPQQVPAPKS